MADFWTDVAAHTDGGFVRAVSEGRSLAVYHNQGPLLWRKTLDTDFLRYTRVAVFANGWIVAGGQDEGGVALLVTSTTTTPFGPTLGMFPVALRVDGNTLHTYRCGPEHFVPVYIDGIDSGIRTHAVEGLREVLADGTILFRQQTAAAVIAGRNFGQFTRKLGWCIGECANSIGCLHEASGHFFTARRGPVNAGIHFDVQTNGDLAVVAAIEGAAYFEVFSPPYPAHEPIVTEPDTKPEDPMAQWPLAPNMKSTVEQVIREHPEIDLTTDATRQAILPLIVKRLNKPGEHTPWGLKAEKKPKTPLDSSGEYNTDAVNFLRPDGLMEIIDVIANGKAFWDRAHTKTPTKQGTNGWWMAAPDPGDDEEPVPDATHTYLGGGNDTGTCDECGKRRDDPVHDTPASTRPHAYDGGEQDTGVCDVCGFPKSGLLHNLTPPIDPPIDLPPAGWAVEAAAIRKALATSDARVTELAAAVDALEQQLAGGGGIPSTLNVTKITLTVAP